MGKTLLMRGVLLLLVASGISVLSGCAMTAEERQRQANSASRRDALLRESVARVRVEDGIDEDEARQIARLYWQKYSATQGALARISDLGARWEVVFIETNSASPVQPILVDKTTGGVTWPVGPTTRTVRELLER